MEEWKVTMAKLRPLRSIHQKESIVQKIRTNPATYIGSIEPIKELQWIIDQNNNQQIVQKEIVYTPGFYKIFDEVLMNAVAHKQRDKQMSEIRIDIDTETNEISIWNNGRGIPIVLDEVEHKWLPTIIFGNSKFDQLKIGGAKMCNMFSSHFNIEIVTAKISFEQSWEQNMQIEDCAVIVEGVDDEDYTKVTFRPDLAKFGMEKFDDDTVGLLQRRAFDVSFVFYVGKNYDD